MLKRMIGAVMRRTPSARKTPAWRGFVRQNCRRPGKTLAASGALSYRMHLRFRRKSMSGPATKKRFRSQEWFDNPDNPGMTALYLERYLNFGLTRGELQSGKPIIGIAQTGSDLSPCNRHHLQLAHRVREGIREAGGIAMEFPVHPIQETGKRPGAALDRNLAYLGLVEVLFG